MAVNTQCFLSWTPHCGLVLATASKNTIPICTFLPSFKLDHNLFFCKHFFYIRVVREWKYLGLLVECWFNVDVCFDTAGALGIGVGSGISAVEAHTFHQLGRGGGGEREWGEGGSRDGGRYGVTICRVTFIYMPLTVFEIL